MNDSQSVTRSRRAVLTSAVLLAITMAGCGQGKGDVSGIIQFKGKPLPHGKITFFNQKGNEQACSAMIDNGAFTVYAVSEGPAKVTVETFRQPAYIVPLERLLPGGAVKEGME